MASSKDAIRLAALLAQSGLKDAFYVKLFGVHQSTVSRLRQGKIGKVQRYISIIEMNGALPKVLDADLAVIVRQLSKLAMERPALRRLLFDMHEFMHESMRDSPQDT